MKKFLTILLTAIIATTAAGFFACAKDKENKPAEPAVLSFYMPDGAPALSVAKFLKDGENFGAVEAGKKYNFYIDVKETVISGKTQNVYFALTTSKDPRSYSGDVNITGPTYFAASMQTFSFSYTFSESHENVLLWFQIL